MSDLQIGLMRLKHHYEFKGHASRENLKWSQPKVSHTDITLSQLPISLNSPCASLYNK